MKYVRSITKVIDEIKGGGDILVGFSGIVERKITTLVRKLRKLKKG